MADALWNNAGRFDNDSTDASTRTNPITLDGLVNARLATLTGTPVPLASLSGNVVYESTPPTNGTDFVLRTGTYNFTGGTLVLRGGTAQNTASRFQLIGQSGQTGILYIGYDNTTNDADVLAENFILHFDDLDWSNVPRNSIAPVADRNTLLNNNFVVNVSPVSRWIVNIPVTTALQTTPLTNGGRNIVIMENSNANTHVRMDINMGRYANNVLVGPDSPRYGGPDLANCTHYYNLTSTVPTRDILYRGDYVDWRPQGNNWAALTGGGFIGDHGIKWLVEDTTTALVSDTNPLIFGRSLQSFELGIDSNITATASSGDGYFELGLSPDTARNNRIVFVNPTGITLQDRLGLWNNRRGRLRVEHQTTQPFHVSDDREFNVANARIVLNHFYPQYGSDTNFGAAPATFFSRNVTSTGLTGSDGTVILGNDNNTDYAAADNSTTVNRPIIVEALELNNTQQGTTTTRIQRDYQSAALQSNAVSYNNYRQRSALQEQAVTYDVFAYGHISLRNQPISFRNAGATADPGLGVQQPVVMSRDLNVTTGSPLNIPGRAANLNDVYDLVHNWAINERRDNPITVNGTTLNFGALSVVFDPNPTSTPNSTVSLSTSNVLRIPTGSSLTATTKFDSLQSTATTPFTTAGVSTPGITTVSTSAPSITLSGFNMDTFINQLAGRVDIFDASSGRSQTATPIHSISGSFSVKNFTFDRSTSGFENMGSYTGPNRITRLIAVYSRPGFEAEEIDIDVSDVTNRSLSFLERVQPYPNNADIGSGANLFTATPTYSGSSNRINTVLGGGGTNRVLTSSQTNRLLMENLYGSAALNSFVFANNGAVNCGSRGTASSWFADGSSFTISAGMTAGLYTTGYIENTDPNTPQSNLGATADVADSISGAVGTRGVQISQTPDEFDLQAIQSLTQNTNTLIEVTLDGFQGDDTPEEQADPSSLRTLRDELRATRNTILGNI